jgi:hypothetical protein
MKRLTAQAGLVAVVAAVALAAGSLVAMAAEGGEAVKPFNGKDLTGWKVKGPKEKSFWTVGKASLDPNNPAQLAVDPKGDEMVNAKGGGLDFYSEYTHGDAIITLEVMVPKGSNSGIYVHGEYEIQVLDSYGKEDRPGGGDMGAIYGAQPPTQPKYVKPGEWSTFEIRWIAPQFDAAGKKTANGKFLKVVLNGATIHENLEMKGPTPGGVDGKEKAKGPLMFQGNHGPVAYRNIVIRPLK